MNYDQKRRILPVAYAIVLSLVLMTGFTSMAAETGVNTPGTSTTIQSLKWELSDGTEGLCEAVFGNTREAVEKARRIAEEQAAAQAEAEMMTAADTELLAALIFCEAGNQPYEGQVAVGAVVMNRVRSGSYPDSIREVIYQSGQFTPAMTGWLDSVLASGGYTDSARQAAQDALAGSNPVGDCLYFSTGGYGTQIGDHYFH